MKKQIFFSVCAHFKSCVCHDGSFRYGLCTSWPTRPPLAADIDDQRRAGVAGWGAEGLGVSCGWGDWTGQEQSYRLVWGGRNFAVTIFVGKRVVILSMYSQPMVFRIILCVQALTPKLLLSSARGIPRKSVSIVVCLPSTVTFPAVTSTPGCRCVHDDQQARHFNLVTTREERKFTLRE